MQSRPENNDAKRDRLDEPNAHLIEENVTLPKDIFRSYPNYILYELVHCTPTMSMFLVNVILILLIVFFSFHDNKICATVFGILLFVLSRSTVSVLVGMFGTHVSDRDFILKLSVEVITRKPAGKEWKAVAYNMNQYLFDEGLWYTPYYFYCGRKCRYFFRNIIIKESAGTHSSSSTNEAENTQSAAPATETSNGAAEPRSIEPVPILKRYMLKARQVEEEAQLEYWRKQYPDANLP